MPTYHFPEPYYQNQLPGFVKSSERDKVTVSGKHREKWKVRNADQKIQFRGDLRQATAVDVVDPTPYTWLSMI